MISLFPTAQIPSRRPAKPVLLLGAVLTAALLSACGATTSTSSFSGAAKSVAQTISDLQNDAQGRNESRICSADLATNVVDKLNAAGNTCTSAITKQLGEADTYDLTIESIKVAGTTATAVVQDTQAGKKHLDTLTLVQEGARWKISALR